MQSSAGWLVLTGEPAGGSDAVSIVTTGDPPRPGDAQRQTGRLLSGHLHLPTARVQSAQAQVYWGPPDVVTLTRTAFVMTRVECRDRASYQLTRVPVSATKEGVVSHHDVMLQGDAVRLSSR